MLSHKDAASIARSLIGSFRASGAIWSMLMGKFITEQAEEKAEFFSNSKGQARRCKERIHQTYFNIF